MKRLFLITALVLSLLIGMVSLTTAQDSFTIGVSNSFVGSEWRTQMIQNMEDVAAELSEEMEIEIELVVLSEDTDVAGQQQQIQNLISRGVDAIIVNPGDQTGLNLDLEEAVEEGIVVIAVDQEVSAEGVINVVIDQKEWAKMSAQWPGRTTRW